LWICDPLAGQFDKRAYTVAAAERLRECLHRHEVFVPDLHKWSDPTAGLLDGTAWEKACPQICRDLGLSPEPGVDLDQWAASLDTAYRQLADGLADNPSVRIEDRDGRDLVLTGLDRLGDAGRAARRHLQEAEAPGAVARRQHRSAGLVREGPGWPRRLLEPQDRLRASPVRAGRGQPPLRTTSATRE
jgi:hypothetical protein